MKIATVIFFYALTQAESFSLMEKGNDVYVPKSEKNEVNIAIVNTNSKDAPTPRVPQYRVRQLRGWGKRSADLEKRNDVPKFEQYEIISVKTNSKDDPAPQVPQYRVFRNLYGKRSADHSDTGTNAVYYSKRTAGGETLTTSETRNVQKINQKLPTVFKIPKKFQRAPY